MDGIVITRLGPGDEAVLADVAEGVFDETPRPELAKKFLETAHYRIVVARDGGLVVGMATGFTHFHPDKDEEFFVNELGVADSHRRRGIGLALMRALLDEARVMGVTVAWVGTERDNHAALALYRKLRGPDDSEEAMSVFTYRIGE